MRSKARHRHRASRELCCATRAKWTTALALFQKAAQIDPSCFIAQQEWKRTEQMINESRNPPPQAAGPPGSWKRKSRKPVVRWNWPPSQIPLSQFNSTEDSKLIYETVGNLAGINVLFDPDYASRRIKVELNGVTLEEALRDHRPGVRKHSGGR